MILLTALLLVLAVGCFYMEALRRIRSREDNAQQRLRELLAHELAHDEQHPTRRPQRSGSLLFVLRDRTAARVQRSAVFAGQEGRDLLDWIEQQLTLAGLRLTAPQAVAIATLCLGGGALTALLVLLTGLPPLFLLAAVFLCAYPPLKLRSLQARRRVEIQAEMLWLLQELMMALSTGAVGIDHALARVAAEAERKPNPLLNELLRAVREYQVAGISREQALRGIADRTGVLSVQTFVETLLNGLQTGAPIGEHLAGFQRQATELWLGDMKTYIRQQEPVFVLGLVMAMFGGLTWIVGMLIAPMFG